VANQLEKKGWVIASGKNCKSIARENLTKNTAKVAIEQRNIVPKKRKTWMEEAQRNGVLTIEILFLDFPVEVCKERALKDKQEVDKQDEEAGWESQLNKKKKAQTK